MSAYSPPGSHSQIPMSSVQTADGREGCTVIPHGHLQSGQKTSDRKRKQNPRCVSFS